MPSLDWNKFKALSGSQDQNFENLCRGLMRLQFGRFGKFRALANQPGVEFHIELTQSCKLGSPPQWFGWQCKFHERTQKGDLRSASKKAIEKSLKITEDKLPRLTDWVLWTPYTLSKKDQEWFYSLSTSMTLHLWSEETLNTYLSGDGVILRSVYFDELILTPEELKRRHKEAVQPIRDRWLEPVHQKVEAERIVRRMLGEPSSWNQMITIGEQLEEVVKVLSDFEDISDNLRKKLIIPFINTCSTFADTLLRFHEILADGDLDIIQQKLVEQKTLLDSQIRSIPRKLRALDLPVSLNATNALDDMNIAQELLDEIEEFLGVGLVAILADAGGGKTQMAAQLTAPMENRPAGIFFHGRNLQRGQTLDDLARHYTINGNPLNSIEQLLAALDAAGKRARCRLPLVIDGLNEAENPKDWKPNLATLQEKVSRYPNVLAVCTLRTGEHRRHARNFRNEQTNSRESFAVMALPENVRKLECNGFGRDVDEAIEKYFDHFRIKASDVEIPIDFFKHPLTLRIFCQVTNPDPTEYGEVKIDHFPLSLSPLFEEYIANSSNRISQLPNLSYSYTADEVEWAIYLLGLELWKSMNREVKESSFRSAVSDTSRSWDSSIVNLLAQEGIIFRNPGNQPGEFFITPAYDALGGYIIANSLLAKHASERKFEWLHKPEVINAFKGENSHVLAYDIFKSLVSLTPRRFHRTQLWKVAPDQFQRAALGLVTDLDPEYLDTSTVSALCELMRENLKDRKRLFSKLQSIRGVQSHPLNCDFLDSFLREMSISDRDISWTEWIRENRNELLNDLLSLEQRWKRNVDDRSISDKLKAKWIMWLLTSTDRELRDVATRTLYWFGRGNAESLFNQTIDSLEINDPYVSERMLAASYGVAMACYSSHNDKDFISDILSRYSRLLYENMFSVEAPYSTTHLLKREYASKTIELASICNSDLLSEKKLERCKPPFKDGGIQNWGESHNAEGRQTGLDSPFRMDFENYTIGRLVEDRRNYDYSHDEYQKIRSQILWRVEQLGWSSDKFQEIDQAIARDDFSPRSGGKAQKTERYGKKYSWIAYFEMSGFLDDRGGLDNWGERFSSVDIDPSFPEPVTEGKIIKEDFLGEAKKSTPEWIESGPDPEVVPYLEMQKVHEEKGPWTMLDGFFVQQDEKRGRRLFCFIRSFLVSDPDVDSFVKNLKQQDLGGRWLPEKPEVIYTFAGEIPWCSVFPENGKTEILFITDEKYVKVEKEQPILFLDGNKLEATQFDLSLRKTLGDTFIQNQELVHLSDKEIERIEVQYVNMEVNELIEEHENYFVQIPVCDFGWEGYQTVASDAGHATTLGKEIALDLNFIGRPQSLDLYTQNGEQATYNISSRENYNNNQRMLFIKKDLLKSYLKSNNLSLVWAIWGEREYSHKQLQNLSHSIEDEPPRYSKVFSQIEKFEFSI